MATVTGPREGMSGAADGDAQDPPVSFRLALDP
jgi:hypothetical protein